MSLGREDFQPILDSIRNSNDPIIKNAKSVEMLSLLHKYKKTMTLTDYEQGMEELLRENFGESFPNLIKSLSPEILFEVAVELVKIDFKAFEVIGYSKEAEGKYIVLSKEQYKEVCLAAVRKDAEALTLIPNEMCDYTLWLAGTKQNGMAISLITDYNEANLTEEQYQEICLIGIKNSDRALAHVKLPDEQYRKMCLDAVNEDPNRIIYVPITISAHEEFKETIKKWQAQAIKNMKESLFNTLFEIPKDYQTYQLFHAYVMTDADSTKLLLRFRDQGDYRETTLLTDEDYKNLLQEIVEKNTVSKIIEATPTESQFKILLQFPRFIEKWQEELLANSNNIKKQTIQNIPESILTQEICNAVVRANIDEFQDELKYIPKQYQTYSLFEVVATSSRSAALLPFLRNYQETTSLSDGDYKNLLKELVSKNGDWALLGYAPREMLLEISLECIRQKKGYELGHILSGKQIYSYSSNEEKQLSQSEYRRVCVAALKKDGLSIQHIPKENRDFELLIESIKQNAAAIRHIGKNHQEAGLSEDDYNKFCLEAVRQNPEVIPYLDEKYKLLVTNSKETCIELVKINGLFLKHIPKENRNVDILLESVKQNGNALKFIGKNHQEAGLSETDFQKICLEAAEQNPQAISTLDDEYQIFVINSFGREFCLALVKQDGMFLRNIPKEKRDFEIYIESVKQNGDAFSYIGRNHQEVGVSEVEYNEICLEATKQNPQVIFYLDDLHKLLVINYHGKDFCIKLVKGNGFSLRHIPKDKWDMDILLASVQKNGEAMQYIGRNYHEAGLSEDDYKKICLEAVKQNLEAMKYIDDEYKFYVIDTLGPEILLMLDYQAIDYFPVTDAYQAVQKKLLLNAEHIVITSGNTFYSDREINDSFMVYAHSPKRKGKTIHISVDSLDRLFSDLQTHQDTHKAEAKPINLVLLGHAHSESKAMIGLDVDKITNLLANHTNINILTLLGCNTAKSQPLEKEKRMAQQYQDTLKTPEQQFYSGMMIVADFPDSKKYAEFFKRMSIDSKGNQIDTLFILVNKTGIKEPCLIELKRDAESGHITEVKRNNLTQDSMIRLGKLIGNKTGKLPTATKNMPIIYYRGGKSTEFIPPMDSVKLVNMVNSNEPRFSKQHPQYKEDKQIFPFMTGGEIDETEEHKILPSLVKKVKDGIDADPRIMRVVIVKGYTKAVHVDTKEQQMKVFGTHLYTAEYKEKEHSSFFSASRDNIDRKKLAKERKREINSMVDSVQGLASNFKSIRVRTKKK